MGQDREASVIDYNRPPKTQPGLWCQWRPTNDRLHIEWDEGEKFSAYVEWIEYIIENVLKPKGYTLSGEVKWFGDRLGDVGTITVEGNAVAIRPVVYAFDVLGNEKEVGE